MTMLRSFDKRCLVARRSPAPPSGNNVEHWSLGMSFLACLLLLMSAGCGQRSERNSASELMDPPPAMPYRIDPAALKGCRGPGSAPGCERCCTVLGDHAELRWGRSSSLYRGTPDGYDAAQSVEACPAGSPPCARCTYYDEEGFRLLFPDLRSCRCDSIPKEQLDPCFSPHSCACVCSLWASRGWKCPPAAL
jgi:hypothetical protein